MPLSTAPSSGDARPAFWGEMAPCEHAMQIYGCDAAFAEALEAFVMGGLANGEAVIVIATPEHRRELRERLRSRGVCLSIAESLNSLILLDAEEILSRFLVNDWPEEALFEAVVADLLAQARGEGRRVRAFGEMVALLWARGLNGATVRLEFLWNQFCRKEKFAVFCAYPKSGFTQGPDESMREICAVHTQVVHA